MDDDFEDDFQPSDGGSDESFSEPEAIESEDIDLDVDAVVGDDDEDDDDEVVEVISKPKKRKPPAKTSRIQTPVKKEKAPPVKPAAVPITAKSKTAAASRSLTRDFSFRTRFTSNYGHDQDFYFKCVLYKDLWQDKMFYVPEDKFRKEFEENPEAITIFTVHEGLDHIPDISVVVAQNDFFSQGRKLELNLQQNSTNHQSNLLPGESFPLKGTDLEGRNAVMLNTGGHVTSMKWLPTDPKDKSNIQYLALSVIFSQDINETVNDSRLSFFSRSTEKEMFFAGVQIWKFDILKNEFELYKFYRTSSTIGIPSDLSWLPTYSTSDVLGVLGGMFSDGKLHLLKIPKNADSSKFNSLETLSVSYEIKGEKITSYAYLGNDKIIVGCSNGSIAEFILPQSSSHPDDDYSIPSFILSVTEAPIASISVAPRGEGEYTILVNSTGSQCFAIEYQDFQHGRIESWPTNSLITPIYNKNLKIFISDDSQDSLTYSYVRHPQEKSTFIMKVDGSITCFHQSEVLQHPLVLNGNSQGELSIVNISRKILNGTKATNKILQPLRLWKISKSDDANQVLKVSADFVISAVDKATNLSIAPLEVSISAIAWNESIESSSIYSVGTASGLLILERLDPEMN